MSLVLADIHDLTGVGWGDRAKVNLRTCCPRCHQRVLMVLPHGLDLHHLEDGTQCLGSWPGWLEGAPRRKRVRR